MQNENNFKKCPNCGSAIHANNTECGVCGAIIAQPRATYKFCGNCNTKIDVNSPRCFNCGAIFNNVNTQNMYQNRMSNKPQKDKVIAAILALLFGSIGVHHFYLGNTGLGLVYLLVCIFTFFLATPIFVVIALIEGIIYLTMDNEEFNQKYNR